MLSLRRTIIEDIDGRIGLVTSSLQPVISDEVWQCVVDQRRLACKTDQEGTLCRSGVISDPQLIPV